MATLFAFLMVAAKAAITMTDVISNPEEIDPSERVVFAQIREKGTGPSTSLYEAAVGESDLSNPSSTGQLVWEAGVAKSFTVSLDEPGNWTISIDGVNLVDQPLGEVNEMSIVIHNLSGLSFQHVSLTNMFLNGESVPSVFTSGNSTAEGDVKGLRITGLDNQPFTLTGSVTMSSDFDQVGHNSHINFIAGSGHSVPEPSMISIFLVSFCLLICRR